MYLPVGCSDGGDGHLDRLLAHQAAIPLERSDGSILCRHDLPACDLPAAAAVMLRLNSVFVVVCALAMLHSSLGAVVVNGKAGCTAA
jgi:hypothetical protein